MSRGIQSSIHALVVFMAVFLTACASGSLTVTDALMQKPIVSTVRVVRADSTVSVAPEATAAFEQRLKQYLYQEGRGRFKDGDEMTISYRFIQLNEGSRAARYFIGFGAGKGSLTVEVTFRSRDGGQIGKINVGGELSGGLFGGDFEEAVDQAAKQASDFAINNFAADAGA